MVGDSLKNRLAEDKNKEACNLHPKPPPLLFPLQQAMKPHIEQSTLNEWQASAAQHLGCHHAPADLRCTHRHLPLFDESKNLLLEATTVELDDGEATTTLPPVNKTVAMTTSGSDSPAMQNWQV